MYSVLLSGVINVTIITIMKILCAEKKSPLDLTVLLVFRPSIVLCFRQPKRPS